MFRSVNMGVGSTTIGAWILVLFWLAIPALVQSSSTPSPSVSFAYPLAESTVKPRLTINVLDTVDLEWESNYGQTWLYLWCDEYKTEDSGEMMTYRWFTKEVFASGDTTYRPWDALESDTNNPTGKYPYSCHFELIYSNEKQKGIVGTIQHHVESGRNDRNDLCAPRYSSRQDSSANTSLSVYSRKLIAQLPPVTSSPSASAALSTGDSGLSAGAKAGIAIGAVFAAAAVAAIGYLFYRHRRKLKELESRAYPQELNVEPKTTATEYYRQDYQPVPLSELEQHHTYELPAQPQEIEGAEHANR